jgi:DNA mismatch repair protein MutS2
MIFPAAVEQKLGFDQLRQRLFNHCASGLGHRAVDQVSFSVNFDFIRTALLQTAEFKKILETGFSLPAQHFFDAEELLIKVGIEESFLEAEELYQIGLSLTTALDCQKVFEKNAEAFPMLSALTGGVALPSRIPSEFRSKLDDSGKVRDNASPELSKIRKEIREEQSRARRIMDHAFRNAVSQGWVPDGSTITVREGRIVIPVSAEHKRKMRGFIIDESATGQTVFLEPAEMLESNNVIRDLFHAERREIIKILKELTGILRDNLVDVRTAFEILGQLELIRAKAKLAIDLNAAFPVMQREPDLNWRRAFHPLLFLHQKGKRDVVPLTIDLTAKERMLLVSGPNAGGKSVCLKTVGLIQYMFQCGLLIPIDEGSTMGIFSNIFLDIGDQQSIENDLSTYSSHLKNMAFFMSNANHSTLVLLDELGAGTDPNFGGGIAQAVLNTLLDKGVWGVATTHYYNLKIFAENRSGIRNGAMLFDVKKLEPLFRLEIGQPGSSFALEIARKTGLTNETIAAAEEIIGHKLTGLDALIRSVGDEKQELIKKATELRQKDQKLGEELARYQKLSGEIESRKKEIINSAKNEASHILKETNREIEKTIRHIRENKAEKKETRKARQKLGEHTEKVLPAEKQPIPSAQGLNAGDKVRMLGQDVTGTLIAVKGDKATVQFGDLRSQLKLQDLVRADQANAAMERKVRSLGLDLGRKQSQFKSTLDIRGKRAEEVIPMIDQFLDDALLLSQSELRILHGKGEGVLRKVVRERLKQNKQVASIRDEHVERGGDGMTVVVLK